MNLIKIICNFLKQSWDNFVWFSLVAMHGDEGDRKFNMYQNTK
jgi:hypothetical protein